MRYVILVSALLEGGTGERVGVDVVKVFTVIITGR